MKRILLFLTLTLSIYSLASAETYYVAVDGNDTHPGTLENPWGTWQKAFETAQAGDTVYFRGGVYYAVSSYGNNICRIAPNETSPIGNDGKVNNYIHYFNYPGETPILDCSKVVTSGNYNTALSISWANYIHFKGLTIRNVYQRTNNVQAFGINVYGATNIIYENLVVHHVSGNAYRFMGDFGDTDYPQYERMAADTTIYLNCDAYACRDSLSEVDGNAADGWKTYNKPGAYIRFEGCRAWNCSDDGFDPGGSVRTDIINCWSFINGFEGAADGNGFKTGGTLDSIPYINRVVRNNIAAHNWGEGFYNLEYSGYYRNNARYYNNIAFRNKEFGYGMDSYFANPKKPWFLSHYHNNIDFENGSPPYLGVRGPYTESHNTWDQTDDYGHPYSIPTDSLDLDENDFLLTDSITGINQLMAPRKADGSLPDITFLQLAPGSDLIDAGVDIGIPYAGSAPDIGPFEYYSGGTDPQPITITSCSPNPTTDLVTVDYHVPQASTIDISVLNSNDEQVLTLSQEAINGNNQVIIDLSGFEAGIYTIKLSNETSTVTCSVTKVDPRQLEITNYSPNPTTDGVTVVFYSPQANTIAISVTNSSGDQVLSLNHDAFSGENNQAYVDLSGQTAGNYTISLDDGTSIVTCSVTKEDPPRLEITNYSPNPTTGGVTVVFFSPQANTIAISVTNSSGIQVLSFNHNAFSGENNQVDVDLSGQAAGIYTITLDDGTSSVSCQVTLQEVTPPRPLEIISSTSTTFDLCTIIYYSPGVGTVSVQVFNSAGQLVLTDSFSSIEGNNSGELNLFELPDGDYRIMLSDGNTSVNCYVTKETQEEPVAFEILRGTPNPTVDLFSVEFTCPEKANILIKVIDEYGRTSMTEDYTSRKGLNKAVLNLVLLPTGNYKIVLVNGQSEINTSVAKQQYFVH
jgi:hypothetical protein